MPQQANPLASLAVLYPALTPYLSRFAYQRVGSDLSGMNRGLEFYQRGDNQSFDPTRPAIQVFGNAAKPLDLVGDLVSHYLARGVDPKLTAFYNQFQKSVTPQEEADLRRMYAQSGDKRSYGDWRRVAGLPAYFRGYAFNQLWPNETHYTKQQLATFDAMMQYLRGGAAFNFQRNRFQWHR